MVKKLVSIALSVVLAVRLVPLPAFAEWVRGGLAASRAAAASAAELEFMLASSESAPLSECAPMGEAARSVRERMAW